MSEIEVWCSQTTAYGRCAVCGNAIKPSTFHYVVYEVWDDDIDDREELYRQCKTCGRPEESSEE